MFSCPWNVDEFVRARSKNSMLFFSRLIFIFHIRCAKRELVITNERNSETKTWQREFLLFHFLCTGIENIKGGTFANIFDWIGALLSKLFRFVVGFANILKKIKTWRHFFHYCYLLQICYTLVTKWHGKDYYEQVKRFQPRILANIFLKLWIKFWNKWRNFKELKENDKIRKKNQTNKIFENSNQYWKLSNFLNQNFRKP